MRVNDLDLHVEVDGYGPPLLLLHGFTGSLHAWDGVRSALGIRARLVLVDLIGHGQSDAPEDAERYTLEWCARDLLAILDELRLERVSVLGYSMGGRVALHLALAAPERITALLLESASPGIADDVERQHRFEADTRLAERIERHGVERFVEEWEQQPLLVLADPVPPNVRVEQHQQRLRNTPLGLANSLRGMGTGRQRSLWGGLPTLRTPTRLLVGEHDARYCAIGQHMVELIPGARLTVAREAGHTVHLDQPDLCIRWASTAL
ncbi:MAG TPA: 2-succinyl-6-hydroxy-2,4-cyclohexadiene-1-carboxylate synthase [Chloroflexota bacterium]|jgi:2-succinyl-6-hydroxy-2,4-cyclohexadiene-1-carboxylate synthase